MGLSRTVLYAAPVAVCLLALLTCSGPAPPTLSQSPEAIRSQLANLKMVEIQLDETDPGARVSLARNLYIIFDGSGSMAEPPDDTCGGVTQFQTKLQGAQWALKTFLGQVPRDMNLGLLVFDDEGVREAVPLGRDNRDALIRAVDQVHAGGGTPLADSIRFGTDRLLEHYRLQLGYGEFRLVVVTDGIADQIPEASLFAMQYGIPIYAIGLCVEADHPLRLFAASFRAADRFEDLQKGLQETLAELPDFDATEFESLP